MNTTSRRTQAVSPRLKVGAAVLAGAEIVDTKVVAGRLRAFTQAYREYVDAEAAVDEAEARFEAERLKLAQVGAEHDEAVEALARCLVSEGETRANPFGDYDTSPSAIRRLAPAEAAREVRTLLAKLARRTNASAATREAGEHLEQVTQKVEAALVPLKKLQDELQAARHMSDVVQHKYDDETAALRRAARAAADEGAPGLYGALFPALLRTARKKPVREQTAAPAQPQPPPSA